MLSYAKNFASYLRRIEKYLGSIDSAGRARHEQRLAIECLQAEYVYRRMIAETPAGRQPGSLLAHGLKLYSQYDEDAIITDIFRRIGESGRTFVEFGAGDGLENNSIHLLLRGWSGAWIEAGDDMCLKIRKYYRSLIADRRLKVLNQPVTVENVQHLF